MKTVLIGASGFLGLHLVQALSGAGHQGKVLTRQPRFRSAISLTPGMELHKADVYSKDQLPALLSGADAVVSMVGILNEKGFGGKEFQKVHVELTQNIVAACQSSGVNRLLHVSAINAGKSKSKYLKTKGLGEEVVRNSGLDWTIFQPSVIFGPGDKFFNCFASILKMTPVLPLACPRSKLQPVYVNDVSCAMARALVDRASHGRVYQLVGPNVYTLQSLVKWTARTLGLKTRVPGLPAPLSKLQALIMNLVPGKPFSLDNYYSLQADSISEDNALVGLGIRPSSIEAIVPQYLGASIRQQRLNRSRRSVS